MQQDFVCSFTVEPGTLREQLVSLHVKFYVSNLKQNGIFDHNLAITQRNVTAR